MDLNTLWFVLVAVLFIGFFVLEGFDYGVGILLPFLGKSDHERRQIINTVGPFWDGNEVWILTAGGAIFAAFPHWYATMFSGLYLALVLLLLALIARGVAFEFRSKDAHPTWRRTFDGALFWGSAIPALLWGVALANLLGGMPIDANKHYVGTFFDLLSPYALLCGLTTLALFTLHGALFLELKSDGEVRRRALATTKRVGPVATVLVLSTGIATWLGTDAYARLGVNPGLVPVLAVGCLLAAGLFVRDERCGWAFAMTSGTIVFLVATLFLALYPRVIVSSLDPAWSLTIHNAASSEKTLGIMSVVALLFVPIVIGYQGWTYWVFRHRVTSTSKLEY